MSTRPSSRNVDCVRAPAIVAFILAGLLAGCAAGPDFQRPAPPEVEGYTAAPMPARTASAPTALGAAQHFNTGASVDTQWWRALGSPKLSELIEEAFRSSPTLSAAKATLRQAKETHSAQTGSTLYPTVDAGMGAQRQRLNPSAFGQAGSAKEFSLYNANLGVHYQLDLSGGNRRSLESLAARAEHRRYELEGAQLTLAANIATAAISQARLTGQIQSTEALLRAQDEQLHLTRERVRSQALSAGALFGGGSAVLSLVAQLTQPLFDRGLPAQKRASLAAFDAAAANYQGVVLESLREVADILRAVENDAEALTSLAKADAAAQGSVESAQKRYALGAAGYVELLLAREKLQQTRIN